MNKIPTAVKSISIPFKIKRSPTELLKALSKTVRLDPVGPAYSLIDDTSLIRTNPFDIRKAHLAKASGIRTARFMIDKYPDAFMKDDCDPHISKFFPPKQFTEKELKYPSESLIFSLMSWGKLKQAYDTLLKCKDEKIDISEECKLALLDLLCINNSDDLKPKPLPQEEYYLRGLKKETDSRGKPILVSTWKKNSEAEALFNELSSKTAQAYCSIIKGMFKYNEIEGGKKLYEEMCQNNLIPDLTTMNQILASIVYEPEARNDKKIELMMYKLREIREFGHVPNLRTFNTCLELIASLGMYQRGIPLCLDILKEMEILGIEPSLGTYASLLEIFYPNKDIGSKTGILGQIIDEVEKMAKRPSGLEWRDPSDANFFPTAMIKCNSGLITEIDGRVLSYTKRLHDICMKDNNIRFLNSSSLHNKYFESYLQALMKFDIPENVIKEWRYYTPYIYNRSIQIFEQIFLYARDNGCYEFILELWSSFLEFRPSRFTNFVTHSIDLLLSTMSEYQGEDQNLISSYGDISQKMIEMFPYESVKQDEDEEDIQTARREFSWNSKMISNFFVIQLKAERLDIIWREFLKYQENQYKIPGELNDGLIFNIIIALREAKHIDKAFDVVKFAVASNMPLGVELYNKLESSPNLDSEKKSFLKQLKDKYNV